MRNSIKIDFSGKELEFFFGLSFLGYFYEKYNSDVLDVYEKLQSKPYSFIPLLMFESYAHNVERKDEKLAYNKFEFTDLLDDNGGVSEDDGAAAKFLKAFVESIMSRLPKNEVKVEEGSKKK